MLRWLMSIADGLNKLRDFPPLFFRLILAWGFHGPFLMKIKNPDAFAGFLASMDYPFPTLNAYIAMIVEGLGILFMFFGFLTRIWAVPMAFVMIVAIATVHWDHGFSAANNGFEIPLYYLLMLFSLFATGPGRISLDALFARRYRTVKS